MDSCLRCAVAVVARLVRASGCTQHCVSPPILPCDVSPSLMGESQHGGSLAISTLGAATRLPVRRSST
jgi:hypothetical protein